MVPFARLAFNGRRVTSTANELARSIPCNHTDLVDSDVVAITDGIGRNSEALDLT